MKINYNLSSVLNIANIYKDKRNYKETIFYQINFVYINLYQSKKLSRNCMTQSNKKYFTILTSVLKIIYREFATQTGVVLSLKSQPKANFQISTEHDPGRRADRERLSHGHDNGGFIRVPVYVTECTNRQIWQPLESSVYSILLLLGFANITWFLKY